MAIYYLMQVNGRLDEIYTWIDAYRGGFLIQKDYDDIQNHYKRDKTVHFLKKI